MLTFKLELDQVWLGTNERTQKLPLALVSIKNVVSEPFTGQEEYHIMALQLGPTYRPAGTKSNGCLHSTWTAERRPS